MLRFTMFIWERVREYNNEKLRKKIDTIRTIVSSRKFEMFYEGYFPDVKLDKARETHILNKLIAETKQKVYFKEGYYNYEDTKKLIPQSLLSKIL